MALEKRYEFVLLFDVENGNPNGDPDAGNMPRIDPETGYGIVTDVCLKRKIRNYVEITREEKTGFDIYVKEGIVLNVQHQKAYKEYNMKPSKTLPKDKQEAQKLTGFMCKNFYDIRTFGAVMSTGVNCGQVRGPVQINFARSIDPIVPQELTITRVTVTSEEEEHKQRMMGRKQIVPYALYRAEGYISAHLAQKVTGFDEADLEVLWESLINLFEHDHSASRGKMASRKLFVFEHSTALGNAPSHVLFDKIKVERKADVAVPRRFEDYEVTVDAEIPQGVSLIEKL